MASAPTPIPPAAAGDAVPSGCRPIEVRIAELRQLFNEIDPSPFATAPMLLPAPEERGFKDTVKANPGQFTTIRAKFELPRGVVAPQTYVHHCHIVEHEDNDMMRPFTVG